MWGWLNFIMNALIITERAQVSWACILSPLWLLRGKVTREDCGMSVVACAFW